MDRCQKVLPLRLIERGGRPGLGNSGGIYEAMKEGLSVRLWIQIHKVGEVEVGMQIAPKSPERLRLGSGEWKRTRTQINQH